MYLRSLWIFSVPAVALWLGAVALLLAWLASSVFVVRSLKGINGEPN